ncbi:2c9d48e6-fa8f-425b-ae70-cdda432ed5d3 [Thermothielavioides terrestris]|uniref:2c9d48e6-fa8f-425b-ae70-cdda432ed5d3 n=1 Tax=Thermothielavioides terrestris TaxID=2587410 RepID=A0A446BGD5_9PEZI|nr:2c9d48e6-fa8f-425b-ae70-cdda432ed5d3 [Thermothielavioides terrestris]
MASHHDGVNPLRPYYIPPTIGEPPEALPTPGPRAFSQANSTGRYASKARDIFSDLDYKDYIAEPSPSVVQTVKELLDELLWKYTSVLMAQPFEVAKTIMQVRVQDDPGGLAAAAEAAEKARQRQASQRIHAYDDQDAQFDSDSDLDESAFFTSNQPRTPSPTLSRSRNPRHPGAQSPRQSARPVPAYQLAIRSPDSVLEVIAQVWQKEGAWGVWKGSNATFIYSVLQSLLENWSRSLLSALFNVPDIGVKNDMDRLVDLASPYPWASLFVAAAAAVTTSLILSPLDLVRTCLVITPTTSRLPRRTLAALRSLPSYLCPRALVAPTVLHALVHPLLTLSTPLVLRSHFLLDRELAPTTFSAARFCASTVALLLKLPLETVLRRGQAAVLADPAYRAALEAAGSSAQSGGRRLGTATAAASAAGGELETVVPVGRYDGVFGTMYAIVYEEGSHAVAGGGSGRAAGSGPRKGKAASPTTTTTTATTTTVAETVYRRGQGLDGLWRGWKVSWWGLVGLWAAGVLGGGGDGEF